MTVGRAVGQVMFRPCESGGSAIPASAAGTPGAAPPASARWMRRNPLRLRRQSYPMQFELEPRWSDVVENGVIGRVGLFHLLEDARVAMMLRMLGPEEFVGGRWKGALRALTVEYPAPASFGQPVQCLGGFDHIGRSSYSYALAVLQGNRCPALASCTVVNLDAESGARPLTDEMRVVLQRHRWAAPQAQVAAPTAPERLQLATYAWQTCWFTRLSDTDHNGHINNVAVLRYVDNALMAFQWACEGKIAGQSAAQHWSVTRMAASLRAECFAPMPMRAGLCVTRIRAHAFELALGLFQEGQCRVTAEVSVALRNAENRPAALPAATRGLLEAAQMRTGAS